MKSTCENCRAEGGLGVIEDDAAEVPAAEIGGLYLEHAVIVLEAMRLAMHLEMCATRDSIDDKDILDNHMPGSIDSRLVCALELDD